jgi:O-antigen ligase
MTDQGNNDLKVIREAGYVFVLAIALFAVRPWRHPERLLVVPWPLFLALGWCALSLSWAVEPGVGARRLALTAIVLWSVFALVREVQLDRAVTILRVILALLLIANFVVVLWYPSFGVHSANEADLAGDWRGVLGQKNFAGLTCAVTVLLFAFDADRVPVWVRLGFCTAATIFLFMSDSATSIGVGVASLLFGGFFAWRAQRDAEHPLAAPSWAWLPVGLAGAVFFSMALNPALYLQMVSDPAGFTGRNQIWSALIRTYAGAPMLGVGYGSLWDLGPEGPISRYVSGWVAAVSQGHNGYLDLLAQIGAPGTLLVLAATMAWPAQRLLRGGDHPARVLGAAMLLFCLGHNFTESTLFDRDALGQVFLMFAIALLWNATGIAFHAPTDARKAGNGSSRRDLRQTQAKPSK